MAELAIRPAPAADSIGWVRALSGAEREREEAIERLHALLLRAARFEVGRRRASAAGELDDLAMQAANDALVAIMSKLHTFRGESRFTTWAYKFAVLEAAAKVRGRAWQGREVPIEPESWALVADRESTPEQDAETTELLDALKAAIASDLSRHQREILVAVTLNGVPIDVLAERLGTTRGALYKTLRSMSWPSG